MRYFKMSDLLFISQNIPNILNDLYQIQLQYLYNFTLIIYHYQIQLNDFIASSEKKKQFNVNKINSIF